MPNNIKLLKWSELFSKSLPTDKSVAILTEGNATAQDRTDVIDALNLDQTSIKPALKTVFENYTASYEDTYLLVCDAVNAVTITLPVASGTQANKIGGVIYIKNECAATVSIQSASGDTIFDNGPISLNQGDSVKLVSNGSSQWYVFAAYVTPP